MHHTSDTLPTSIPNALNVILRIWNLTAGQIHVTDVTNASRTLLFDLHKRKWSDELCHFFGISQEILPVIRSSAEIYGVMETEILKGVPISGDLGDQVSFASHQKPVVFWMNQTRLLSRPLLLVTTASNPAMQKIHMEQVIDRLNVAATWLFRHVYALQHRNQTDRF